MNSKFYCLALVKNFTYDKSFDVHTPKVLTKTKSFDVYKLKVFDVGTSKVIRTYFKNFEEQKSVDAHQNF
jgi:hypothetical protein